jgi:hypothetical protein
MRIANSLRFLICVPVFLSAACTALAQDSSAPKKPDPNDKYDVHQTFDLGGHITDYSGSGPVFDTLANLHSGPRILDHTLNVHALKGARHTLFDTLFTDSSGYGGDPNSFSVLRISKGKLYDFQGTFRRDRLYFDYNLFGNPLVPSGLTTTTGYTFPQVNDAPHLFNTVRRMTDLNLTLFPLSKVSVRAGFSHNINQGPTFSSVHFGSEALLNQFWRNSTDNWLGAVDWKPFRGTTFTFEEHVTHYKGDTVWQLTGLDLQLSNGDPVSLGFGIVSLPKCGDLLDAVTTAATDPPTANPTCSGYLQYSRTQPTRVLFPTEEFRFQTSGITNVRMTGRVRYTQANMNLPAYSEFFNGLQTRGALRTATLTGNARGHRINVGADYGIVWSVTKWLNLSDQFDFQNFRQTATGFLSEVDQAGTSMLDDPGPALTPVITETDTFLGQKTHTNTLTAEFFAAQRFSISIGYRFRNRTLASGVVSEESLDIYNDHQHSGLLGIRLQPAAQWRVNANFEIGTSDNSYVQIDPRQWQKYQVRSEWKAKSWATVSASFSDLERRDNVTNVNFLAHDRSFTATASLAHSEHYGIDLSYGYLDIFSRVTNCFADTFAPAGSTLLPTGVDCGNVTGTSTTPGYYGNSYFDAPTQYGSFAIAFAPVKALHTRVGYRMSATDGHTELLNPLAPVGSLQSQFQTPYATATWTINKGWGVRGEWNYYSYGEGTPIGPTLPRSFRGNVYTLGVHNEF